MMQESPTSKEITMEDVTVLETIDLWKIFDEILAEAAYQEKQASLVQIFNETSAAAHNAFPLELENLVVLRSSSEIPVYVSPEITDHLTKNTAAVKSCITETAFTMLINDAAGFAARSYPLAGVIVKMVALDKNNVGDFSPQYTKETAAIFALDHELGHHVVENGHPSSGNLGESAADAYATLRHIQRFGKKMEPSYQNAWK